MLPPITTPIDFMLGGAGAASEPTAQKTEEIVFASPEDINPVMEEFTRTLNSPFFRENYLQAQQLLIEALKNPEFLPGLPAEIRKDPFTKLGIFQQSLVKWVDWSRYKGSSFGSGISDVMISVLNASRFAGKAILMGVNNFSDFHPKICAGEDSPVIQMIKNAHNFVQEQSLNPYFSIPSLFLPTDGTMSNPIDVRHVGVVIPAKAGVITEFDMEIRAYQTAIVALLFRANGTITTLYIPPYTSKKIYIQNADGNFSHSGIKPKEDDTTYESEMETTSDRSERDDAKKPAKSSHFDSCLFCLTIPVEIVHPTFEHTGRGVGTAKVAGMPLAKGMGGDPFSIAHLKDAEPLTSKRRAPSLTRAVPGEIVEGSEVVPQTYSDPEFPNSRIRRVPGQPLQLTCFDLICASNSSQAASIPAIFHCLLHQFILMSHPNVADFFSPPVGSVLKNHILPNDLAVMLDKFAPPNEGVSFRSTPTGFAGAGSASGSSAGAGSAGPAKVKESRDPLVDAFFELIRSNDLDALNSYNGDIHYINGVGNTGLMSSIILNLRNSFNWCIKQGVGRSVDRKHPQRGTTALMLAATHESDYFVKALIDAGANPLLKDFNGYTALDHAINSNRTIPATYLLRTCYNLTDEVHYEKISEIAESHRSSRRPIALSNLDLILSKAPGFETITPSRDPSKKFGWGSQARPQPKRKVIDLKTREVVTILLADIYTNTVLAKGKLDPADAKHPYLINSEGDNLFMVVVRSLNKVAVKNFLEYATLFKEYCNEQNDYGQTVLHSLVLATADCKSALMPAQISALKVVDLLDELCPKLDKTVVDYHKKTAAALAEELDLPFLAAGLSLEEGFFPKAPDLRYGALPLQREVAPPITSTYPTTAPGFYPAGAGSASIGAPAEATAVPPTTAPLERIKGHIRIYNAKFKVTQPIFFGFHPTMGFEKNFKNLIFVLRNRGLFSGEGKNFLFYRIMKNLDGSPSSLVKVDYTAQPDATYQYAVAEVTTGRDETELLEEMDENLNNPLYWSP